MSLRLGVLSSVLLFGASNVFGQGETTVQLPEFQFFTVQTTVSVPDSGRGFMGGVNRAGSSRTTRGAPYFGRLPGVGRGFRTTGIGTERSASSVSASATIIDHTELDRAVLAEAAAKRERLGGPLRLVSGERKADYLSSHVGHGRDVAPLHPVEPSESAARSVAELRRKNELAEEARNHEAATYFAKAKSLEDEGKKGAAKIYYKMAGRRAGDELKAKILARLEVLESKPAVASRDR